MDLQEWLSPCVRNSARERTLAAGQTLFHRGDRADGLYEVISGRIRLTRMDPDGRELVLGIACAGDTIAEASLFSAIYCCDAVAITKVLVRASGNFLEIALTAFGVVFLFNLVDWLVLDWLILCAITPKFVVLPGTAGMPGYKEYGTRISRASWSARCFPSCLAS
jgi:hypothetical protein